MKQITVISGKGGTGKTVVTGSLAALAENKVMADCDVDAADLHLLLHPEIKEKHEFKGSKKAIIDEEKCTLCERCIETCRFDAIINDQSAILIDPLSCEGCGACSLVCPEDAIDLKEEVTGEWFVSGTKYGTMVHAELEIAQENSGKLVSVVREKAKDIALQEGLDYVIIDGPPGIGCPVIASLSGIDIALVVTEPTLSGIHDLKRIIGVCQHFGINEIYICINKFDLSISNSHQIERYCKSIGIQAPIKIPYDEKVIKSVVQGIPYVEYSSNGVGDKIKELWQRIKNASSLAF